MYICICICICDCVCIYTHVHLCFVITQVHISMVLHICIF